MSLPVTISITRHVAPEQTDEMLAWIQAGSSLAARFDGFLGSGWVRPGPGSEEWHMLYRFADPGALEVWESSAQRGWWLAAGRPFVKETRVERRTGIEGWFDPPRTYDVEEVSGVAATPPPWKQAITIFLLFFPLSLLVNFLIKEFLGGLPLVLRVLAASVVMIPFMTYFGLPWITRRMEWFLQGRPAPWRRKRSRPGDDHSG